MSRSYLLWAIGIGATFIACQGELGQTSGQGDPGGDGAATGDGGGGGTGSSAQAGGLSGDGDIGSVSCDVEALLDDECGACHGVEATFGGLDLILPDLDARLSDVPSVSCPDWVLVSPGSPERSLLYQKIAAETPPCGDRMPLDVSLSEEQIACIAGYIRDLAGDTPVLPCETCGGTLCVDLETDVAHCGACGEGCSSGEQCVNGTCEGCPSSTEACGGGCVDLSTDSANCGGCGVVCGGGQACEQGVCICNGGATTVSFATDIQPILADSCATSGCHQASGMTPGGRPSDGGPGNVKSELILDAGLAYEALVGVPSGCSGMNFVEPGDVSASYLMNKLTGSEMCAGTKMPKGGAPLTQAQLDLIGNWICAGAENN
jgi:hypothetical protein